MALKRPERNWEQLKSTASQKRHHKLNTPLAPSFLPSQASDACCSAPTTDNLRACSFADWKRQQWILCLCSTGDDVKLTMPFHRVAPVHDHMGNGRVAQPVVVGQAPVFIVMPRSQFDTLLATF